MQIDSLHIHEQEFDLFVNLKPKQKIEFLYDLQSKGMDAALSKVVIPPLQEEFEVEEYNPNTVAQPMTDSMKSPLERLSEITKPD